MNFPNPHVSFCQAGLPTLDPPKRDSYPHENYLASGQSRKRKWECLTGRQAGEIRGTEGPRAGEIRISKSEIFRAGGALSGRPGRRPGKRSEPGISRPERSGSGAAAKIGHGERGARRLSAHARHGRSPRSAGWQPAVSQRGTLRGGRLLPHSRRRKEVSAGILPADQNLFLTPPSPQRRLRAAGLQEGGTPCWPGPVIRREAHSSSCPS